MLQNTFMAPSLPANVFELQGDPFFQLVQQQCGATMVAVLRYLEVNSADCLLGIQDLFSFFYHDSSDLVAIKKMIGITLNDGTFRVKAGLSIQANNFIQSLKMFQQHENIRTSDDLIISDALLNQHPILRRILRFFVKDISESNDFHFHFKRTIIETLIMNHDRSRCRFHYNSDIREFASCLFILGGRNVYEFVRINIPGFLPSLPVIQALIDTSTNYIQEGEFRYDVMSDYLSSRQSKFAFAAEDCTSIVPKITYNAQSNIFTGFVPPLAGGLPLINTFSTESFTEFQRWISTLVKSHLLNVHMIQPITPISDSCSPFLLSAYGTDNRFTAKDIVLRWVHMVDECAKTGKKLVGIATDCDSRYLRSMRLLMGFFADMPNQQFYQHDDAFHVNIPQVSYIF